jgi:hypothetical protein
LIFIAFPLKGEIDMIPMGEIDKAGQGSLEHLEQVSCAQEQDESYEKQQSPWETSKQNPWLILCCLIMSLSPFVFGFDNIIISLMTAMPAFQ